jgi:hypothetical protein
VGEKVYGSCSAQLLPVLQLLVELRRRQRKYGDAEGYCQRALGISGAELGPQHLEVAAWKNVLAQVGACMARGTSSPIVVGLGGGWAQQQPVNTCMSSALRKDPQLPSVACMAAPV